MEQQVWSILHARQSTLRPRVAVLLPHGAFQEHAAYPPEWSEELSSKGSERTCIRSGLATFLHCAFTAHSNLVVTSSVLHDGLDISSCYPHRVSCADEA
jgi:hypothetical protein